MAMLQYSRRLALGATYVILNSDDSMDAMGYQYNLRRKIRADGADAAGTPEAIDADVKTLAKAAVDNEVDGYAARLKELEANAEAEAVKMAQADDSKDGGKATFAKVESSKQALVKTNADIAGVEAKLVDKTEGENAERKVATAKVTAEDEQKQVTANIAELNVISKRKATEEADLATAEKAYAEKLGELKLNPKSKHYPDWKAAADKVDALKKRHGLLLARQKQLPTFPTKEWTLETDGAIKFNGQPTPCKWDETNKKYISDKGDVTAEHFATTCKPSVPQNEDPPELPPNYKYGDGGAITLNGTPTNCKYNKAEKYKIMAADVEVSVNEVGEKCVVKEDKTQPQKSETQNALQLPEGYKEENGKITFKGEPTKCTFDKQTNKITADGAEVPEKAVAEKCVVVKEDKTKQESPKPKAKYKFRALTKIPMPETGCCVGCCSEVKEVDTDISAALEPFGITYDKEKLKAAVEKVLVKVDVTTDEILTVLKQELKKTKGEEEDYNKFIEKIKTAAVEEIKQ